MILRIWDSWAHAQTASALARLGRDRKEGPELAKVEKPLAAKLKKMGHKVSRQVNCAGGRVDIVDYTSSDLIECKADGYLQSIVDAAKQLKGYQPSFPGMRLCIAVPFIDASAIWMAESLRQSGFHFIETDFSL